MNRFFRRSRNRKWQLLNDIWINSILLLSLISGSGTFALKSNGIPWKSRIFSRYLFFWKMSGIETFCSFAFVVG